MVLIQFNILSHEITVSLLPPDYDLDGILDNIDLDIDNDGILNTTESNGDIDLDLSDFYNPLNFMIAPLTHHQLSQILQLLILL